MLRLRRLALGAGSEQAAGEEAQHHGYEAEVAGRGAIAAFLPLAAQLLTQHALEVWWAQALLVLNARAAILTQQQLPIAHVGWSRERKTERENKTWLLCPLAYI